MAAKHAKSLKTEDGVSPREENLVHNIISGMTLSQAGRAAGYEFNQMKDGVQTILKREPVAKLLVRLREEARRRAQITQDDVLQGFQSAINDAKITGDPQAQIAGWREIAKVLGFYAPEVKKVEISKTEEKARRELSQMPEEELLKLAGDDVLEGEFSIIK